MRRTKGVLIGLEGIDAAGKKTQTSLLESGLRSRGLKVTTMSFPDYTTVIGKEIRGFLEGTRIYPPEVRHMLFAANRWEKKDWIEGLLERGDVVLVNRYTESNLAYGVANGLRLDWLSNLEEGLPRTDLVLVLDAPPSATYDRRASTGKDQWERDLKLQEQARAAYLRLARKFGWRVVDASLNIDEIRRSVSKAVSTLLGPGSRRLRE